MGKNVNKKIKNMFLQAKKTWDIVIIMNNNTVTKDIMIIMNNNTIIKDIVIIMNNNTIIEDIVIIMTNNTITEDMIITEDIIMIVIIKNIQMMNQNLTNMFHQKNQDMIMTKKVVIIVLLVIVIIMIILVIKIVHVIILIIIINVVILVILHIQMINILMIKIGLKRNQLLNQMFIVLQIVDMIIIIINLPQ